LNREIVRINASKFIELSDDIPVVDVRTPAEFISGHIPVAVNIPLFSNKEREEVGTIYKQKGQYEAILRGLDIVGPLMSELLDRGVKLAGKKKKLLVYCWRGGKRSESMSWLFTNAGIKCYVLEEGYKGYRNYILKSLSGERKTIILGGLTGSGKTDVLKVLRSMGEQVVDLEGLANHKGSAFGGLGQEAQPPSEHFSNILFNEIRSTDPSRRLFLEDESHSIGTVVIPDEFFRFIRESKVIAIMPDVEARLPRLLREYGVFNNDQLIDSVNRIRKRLGGLNTDRAIRSIETGNISGAIRIVLEYYDKTYHYGLSQRPAGRVFRIKPDSNDPEHITRIVIDKADEICPDQLTVS
jgi:tRNA 2-selenouridine synthase